MGGEAPSAISTVDRLDYSSDTTNCVAKLKLSSVRQCHQQAIKILVTYWWWIYPTGPASIVDRLDYQSDTLTATPKVH